MNLKESLMESTILALQGKLQLNEDINVTTDNADVVVAPGTTVISDKEATITINKNDEDHNIISDDELNDDTIEVPTSGDETIIPEQVIDNTVEDMVDEDPETVSTDDTESSEDVDINSDEDNTINSEEDADTDNSIEDSTTEDDLDESKKLQETGEWDDNDEDMSAWKADLKAEAEELASLINGEVTDVRGFDKYQGPIATISIPNKDAIEMSFDNEDEAGYTFVVSYNNHYITGTVSELADMINNNKLDESKMLKESNKVKDIKPEETTIKTENKKYNSSSFIKAIEGYLKENNVKVESFRINKFLKNENALKIYGSMNDKEICLEGKLCQKGKKFTKYDIKEATGCKEESLNNTNLSLLTFTNKDNILECKYFKKAADKVAE